MTAEQWESSILYRQIAEDIRQKILSGVYQPGTRLPTIRELKQKWHCTPGTVQHAYQELAQQGLVVSRVGKGTHVAVHEELAPVEVPVPWRKAKLVHRAETFLLESLITGYSFEEIEESLSLARQHVQPG